MDNDGDLDLVIADAHRPDGTRGPALLVNDWPQGRFVRAAELDPGGLLAAIDTGGDASLLAADFTGDGRNDVFLASAGEPPMLIERYQEKLAASGLGEEAGGRYLEELQAGIEGYTYFEE